MPEPEEHTEQNITPEIPEVHEDKAYVEATAAAQLLRFGQQNFQEFAGREITGREFFNYCSVLAGLKLAEEHKDPFITVKRSLYLPAAAFSLIIRFDRWCLEQQKFSPLVSEQYVKCVKRFLMWISAKSLVDSEFLALSTLELIKKETLNSLFFTNYLAAIIYANDRTYMSFEKANKILDQIDEQLRALKLPEELRTGFEALQLLYRGIFAVQEKKIDAALFFFQDLAKTKRFPQTVNYFLIMLSLMSDQLGESPQLFTDCVALDVARLQYALQASDHQLFHFFLEYASVYLFFKDPVFYPLLAIMKELFLQLRKDDEHFFRRAESWVERLEVLHVEKYLNDKAKEDIQFFIRFLTMQIAAGNTLYYMITDKVKERFQNVLYVIRTGIEREKKTKIEEELARYSKLIQEKKAEIDVVQKELEEKKTRVEKQSEANVAVLHLKYDEFKKKKESDLEKLLASKEFEPNNRFKKTISGAVVIALLMLFLGGLLEVTGSDKAGDMQLASFLTAILIKGFKWGALIGLLGFLVAIFVAVTGKAELAREKNNLISSIKDVDKKREKDLLLLQKQFEKATDLLEKEYKKRLDELWESLEERQAERRDAERKFTLDLGEEYQPLLDSLDSVMK